MLFLIFKGLQFGIKKYFTSIREPVNFEFIYLYLWILIYRKIYPENIL
jgi:hypothetical protein